MKCPKCMNSDVTLVGNSHYICNNPNCIDNEGNRTQFRFVIDDHIKFPYNQIYRNRPIDSFFRKPYLEIKSVGNESVNR